ncbi:ribonuclease III [Leptospira sp. GIMC2001]|uniref:ribonuclease III n=1 Tax=Leptospira sp. GIMC2001 TaxID=1513297 RepID=UPI00234BF845|nr:ribonuclease III [Leptospira sp. GIMC2001]WCL48711.1 ribonuclease III [Leptospira sp. GIMC2001]
MRKRNSSEGDPREFLTPDRIDQLTKLQKKIRTRFLNIAVLDEAFTHRSFANESGFRVSDNERLEFLGDSILGFITAELLYKQYANISEGKLAKFKSKLVSGPVLSRICEDLNLSDFLRFGKGEVETGKSNLRVMENLVEALLGAMYLDLGLESCKKFIIPHLSHYLHQLEDLDSVKDYKSILQEICQKKFKKVPKYELVSAEGPDHDKDFIVRVELPDGFIVKGNGKNKRSAEHSAAKNLLATWKQK